MFEDFPPREVWSFGQSFSAMVDFPGFKTSNPKAKPANVVQRMIDWGEALEKSLMDRKTRGPSDHVQFQLRDMGLPQNYVGNTKIDGTSSFSRLKKSAMLGYPLLERKTWWWTSVSVSSIFQSLYPPHVGERSKTQKQRSTLKKTWKPTFFAGWFEGKSIGKLCFRFPLLSEYAVYL